MSGLAETAVVPAESIGPASPSSQARVSVEVRTDLDLPLEDAATIDAILGARAEIGVFLSRAWLSGFFVEPPPRVTPLLVVFRSAGALCGLVPIAVQPSSRGVRVGLLGGGRDGSDRVDLVAARGCEIACSDAFIAWAHDEFGRRALILELRDVPAESALWGAIARASADRSMPTAVQPREIHTQPYLMLADAESSRLVGGPAGDHMPAGLRKHRRWLERRGLLRIEPLLEGDDVLAAFETLCQFLHARWNGSGRGSVLDRPRKRRFHERVIPFLLAERRLRMIRFSSGMRPIAVFYGLASGTWQGYYLAGYDREWAGRIHLGQITLAAAIDAARCDGAAEFDFLKGVERAKYVWPVRERTTVDADVYSERSGAHLKRAAWATREAAGAFVKSLSCLVSTDR